MSIAAARVSSWLAERRDLDGTTVSTGETITRYVHPRTGRPCRRTTRGATRIIEPKLRQVRFGLTTSIGSVTAHRMFGRWLVTSGRSPSNPFASLATLNARIDRRHERRTLSADDFNRLLSVTRQSGRTFRGLNGPARYHLDLLGARSGLRCSELGSLTLRIVRLRRRPADGDDPGQR